MGNIIQANEKRMNLLSNIGSLGCFMFILTGVIGCNIIEDGGSTFGWILFGVGVVLYLFMYSQQYILKEGGGPLTRRKLSDEDLEGLKKEDLERLRCHIYARHGYNFNVNEGLYYLAVIDDKLHKLYPNGYRISESEIPELSNVIGCHAQHLEFVLQFNELSKKNLDNLSEEKKEELRTNLDSRVRYSNMKIGEYNRKGDYNSKSIHYYYFKHYDWYKPTTCNMKEVYSKMSEIEKYNVELIKAHEAKAQ